MNPIVHIKYKHLIIFDILNRYKNFSIEQDIFYSSINVKSEKDIFEKEKEKEKNTVDYCLKLKGFYPNDAITLEVNKKETCEEILNLIFKEIKENIENLKEKNIIFLNIKI